MDYFISDLHIGHKNVLSFDQRAFKTIEGLIYTLENWNNTVTTDDTVYLLGDISWYSVNKTKEIMQQLPGKKVWVLGNHDLVSKKSGFKKRV